VLSLPSGTLRGRLRVTVQGESIDSTLGIASIAVQSLDLYVASVLETMLAPPPEVDPSWRVEMDRLAADATDAYRSLVHREPKFVAYFRAVTPERELGLIHAGSRPARRKASDDVASLRAIPWVFAWNQVRLLLPSWLGVGEALEAALADPQRAGRVQKMAHAWPFFRSLAGLVSMSLAKGDPAVARMYEQQLVPTELAPIGEELRKRFDAAVAALVRVLGQQELLADEPILKGSVALRNPYIDPLNILQAELLRRVRSGDSDSTLLEALLVTVNGIAAGLRNTG
jgi:phosphoenolpyruvate carboxylase